MIGHRFLCLFLCILVAFAASIRIASESFAGDKKPVSLKVGTWKTAQTITPYFYEKFARKDYEITVFPFTNPGDQKTALLAGSLDVTGTTLVHAIASSAKGAPVVVVCALCDKCSALVARKGQGIREPADLRGKRIGYVPGTMHDVLLRETLIQVGLDPAKDVTLLRVDFFDMGLALARGNIDAFLSGEPYPTLAVVQGYGELVSYPYYNDSIGPINAAMIVTRESVIRRRNLIQEAVTAHARTTEYLNRNPDLWLKHAESFGIQPEILRKSAENIALVWRMDDEYIRRAQALGLRMQVLGMIDRQPDYAELFDLSFIGHAEQELLKD